MAVHTGNTQGTYSNSNRGRSNSQYSSSKSNVQRLCTHCGRQNHTVETCFLKHGYPSNFPNGYKPKKAYITTSGGDSHSSSDQDEPPSSSLELTREQLQGLLALLPQSKPTAVSQAPNLKPIAASNLVSSHNVIANNIDMVNSQWIMDSGQDHFEDDWES
ncbi:uncharacterized protein LOC130716662 [Lotus japonicus]|uniref:uncharacterized protein LOC130716662 n=1 Tax=Lotus japonicus TaxID=34305 RepID=UPI0025850B76|nr:uncharacterized protein LOC130716662 [Lotus japonicus]